MKIEAGAAALILALMVAPSTSAQDDGLTTALQAAAFSFGAHSESRAEDIYKGIHQALFGPGHAIPDPESARRYLLEEVAGLGPRLPTDRLCETLGGDPKIVRVNLRPFVDRDGDLEALFEAFVATAGEVTGSPSDMDQALQITESWLRSVGEDGLADDLDRLRTKMAKQDFPAIHHSQRYVQAYDPAYRIVTALLAEEHSWCQ